MQIILKNLASGLLLAFVVKMLVLGTSLPEMGVCFSLVGLVALQSYLEKHKIIQDLVENQNKQNEVITKMAEKLVTLETNISGLRLQQGMRKVGS